MKTNILNTRRHSYTYLTEQEYDELDKAVTALGFNNRAEFQTACALVVINGENTGEWCKKLNQRLTTTNRAQTAVNSILDNIFLAALAMKGFSLLREPDIREDIRRDLLEETGYIPSDDELTAMFEKYRHLRKDRLAEHRRCVFAAKYGTPKTTTDTEE